MKLTDEQIESIMEQAQVFASGWSLVGGPFDYGDALATAEQEKANLRAMLGELAAHPVADAAVAPNDERKFTQGDMERYGKAYADARDARRTATTEVSPEFTDSARAALVWVLYHHQGGSSPVGQPIRFALGMGAHDPLTPSQIGEALKLAKVSRWSTARELPRAVPTAAVAADAGALSDELASMTRMFHAACADLGVVNKALGLDPDDGGAEPILDAIAKLKGDRAAIQYRTLTDDEIDEIANDGCRNAAGGIYATSVYEFARAIEQATIAAPSTVAADAAAPYSAPFTTDVLQCCGDPASCNDPCQPKLDQAVSFDDVKPLVDEWIRSRGTSMDGESYFAALQLAQHVRGALSRAADAAAPTSGMERAFSSEAMGRRDEMALLNRHAETPRLLALLGLPLIDSIALYDVRVRLEHALDASEGKLDEEAHVAQRMTETLAEVYATIIGDDPQRDDDSLNAIERVKKAAQVLRLEVELYRAQAAAQPDERAAFEGFCEAHEWPTDGEGGEPIWLAFKAGAKFGRASASQAAVKAAEGSHPPITSDRQQQYQWRDTGPLKRGEAE